MALTPLDLIQPTGELIEAMFPDRRLLDHVGFWLAEAVGKSEDEDYQRHWVYGRAKSAVANRLATEPNSIGNFGEMQRSIGSDRIKFFQEQAAVHFAECGRILAADSVGDGRLATMWTFGKASVSRL